jgi:hypothetical protein
MPPDWSKSLSSGSFVSNGFQRANLRKTVRPVRCTAARLRKIAAQLFIPGHYARPTRTRILPHVVADRRKVTLLAPIRSIAKSRKFSTANARRDPMDMPATNAKLANHPIHIFPLLFDRCVPASRRAFRATPLPASTRVLTQLPARSFKGKAHMFLEESEIPSKFFRPLWRRYELVRPDKFQLCFNGRGDARPCAHIRGPGIARPPEML